MMLVGFTKCPMKLLLLLSFLQCVTTMSITIWLGGGVPSAECHLVCSAAAAAAAVQYC